MCMVMRAGPDASNGRAQVNSRGRNLGVNIWNLA